MLPVYFEVLSIPQNLSWLKKKTKKNKTKPNQTKQNKVNE